MSSEKRRIAPKALDKDVPPLKIRVGASSFCSSKRCFRVQQTQKSFSTMVLATPRAAPVSPNKAARSEASRSATLSINHTRDGIGDGDECRPHPCRRLHGARGERLLVAPRDLARGDVDDVGRPHGAEMPQSLNDRAGGAAPSDQVLGRGMTQGDDPLAKHGTAGADTGPGESAVPDPGGPARSRSLA